MNGICSFCFETSLSDAEMFLHKKTHETPFGTFHGLNMLSYDLFPEVARVMEEYANMVVNAERHECAKLAWKMQQESFGGGTAIGNAIQDRREKI
jgi:hypothetical protein